MHWGDEKKVTKTEILYIFKINFLFKLFANSICQTMDVLIYQINRH